MKNLIDPFRTKKPLHNKIHMTCPVCRFHKTFAGPCCRECEKLGYRPNPKKPGKLTRIELRREKE